MLDFVRAAEQLIINKPSSPTEITVPKSPKPVPAEHKTTTIVMSKHTLAPQLQGQQQPAVSFIIFFLFPFWFDLLLT